MKVIKILWNIVTTVVVVFAVLLAVALAGVRLVGFQPYAVLSGSMEPTYHVGSLIYVKDVDPYQLEEGDVITFMVSQETLATHRIVGVVQDEEDPSVIRFRTKGDANTVEDGTLVHYRNVVGSPAFTVPYLGFVADYIQNPPGKYVTLAAGSFFLLLMFLPELWKALTEEDAAKKETDARTEEDING